MWSCFLFGQQPSGCFLSRNTLTGVVPSRRLRVLQELLALFARERRGIGVLWHARVFRSVRDIRPVSAVQNLNGSSSECFDDLVGFFFFFNFHHFERLLERDGIGVFVFY